MISDRQRSVAEAIAKKVGGYVVEAQRGATCLYVNTSSTAIRFKVGKNVTRRQVRSEIDRRWIETLSYRNSQLDRMSVLK